MFTVKVKLQLNATNEIVAADAAADNKLITVILRQFCSDVTPTLIDSDSPAQILK